MKSVPRPIFSARPRLAAHTTLAARPTLAACAALLLLAAGCDAGPSSGLPVTPMVIGSKTFNLEIARTDADREKGLMQRDDVPADHGMIFVFPTAEERTFWMKNTRIPLDILFLDGQGKVVSAKQMKAYDLHTTSSDGPAEYAIELNLGQTAAAGVHAGDQLKLPDAAVNPPAKE